MDPFTLVLLFMLGFAVLIVAGLANKRRTGPLLPRIVAGGAMVFAVLSAVAGIVAIVNAFALETLALRVPVFASIELTPVELRDSASQVTNDATQQTTMLLTATGLDGFTRVLVAAEVVSTTAVVVTILFLVARLAQRSTDVEPFSPRLARLFVVGGTTLAVGAIASQIAGILAGQRAHEQLFAIRDSALAGGVNVPPGWTLDLLPIGIGLALIVVAGLIRSGERLQRDTVGLV